MQTSTADTDPDYLDRLIEEREAATFLGFTIRALQNWRTRGGGPPYIKIGNRAVRYRRRDLIEWVQRHRIYHSSINAV